MKDIPCNKIIVGSTQNPKERWANYKSCCNKGKSNGTGLSKHFMEGCPHDTGPQKQTLNITLIDYYDTTKTKLLKANHVKGPQCRCNECNILKSLEDKWILKLGSFYGKSGSLPGIVLICYIKCPFLNIRLNIYKKTNFDILSILHLTYFFLNKF